MYEKKGFTSFQEFFHAMNNDQELLNEFLDRMTINVSEFYRNKQRWDVLENKIFPTLLKNGKPLKIWSALHLQVKKPYTIAMVLSKHVPLSSISILATDIDVNAIQRAKLGIYPERSLNEVPEDIKNKYFEKQGSYYHVVLTR